MGPHIMAEKYTHYSYLCSPIRPSREPTGMYDLRDVPEFTRRLLIQNLVQNGELLATLPFEDIKNMRQLRGAIKWMDENK